MGSISKDDNIEVFGLLNRDIKEQREKLEYLRKISDIFVLPTHAECAGIVFCEACAYSMPSITYDTGGIPDYVINDYNGYRLPLESKGRDFADAIIKIQKDGKMQMLQDNAGKMYNDDLNWKHFAQSLKEIIDNLSE